MRADGLVDADEEGEDEKLADPVSVTTESAETTGVTDSRALLLALPLLTALDDAEGEDDALIDDIEDGFSETEPITDPV